MVRPATPQEIIESERHRLVAEWMEARAQAAAELQLQAAFERMGEQIRANPEKYLNPDPSAAFQKVNIRVKTPPAPEPEPELRPVLLILI